MNRTNKTILQVVGSSSAAIIGVVLLAGLVHREEPQSVTALENSTVAIEASVESQSISDEVPERNLAPIPESGDDKSKPVKEHKEETTTSLDNTSDVAINTQESDQIEIVSEEEKKEESQPEPKDKKLDESDPNCVWQIGYTASETKATDDTEKSSKQTKSEHAEAPITEAVQNTSSENTPSEAVMETPPAEETLPEQNEPTNVLSEEANPVQTEPIQQEPEKSYVQVQGSDTDLIYISLDKEVYVTKSGKKFHIIPKCGNTDVDGVRTVTVKEAMLITEGACKKCFSTTEYYIAGQ